MRSFFILLLLAFFTIQVNASDSLVEIYYLSSGNESLKEILKTFNISDSVAYGKTDFFNKVKKWNPQITNFDLIPKSEGVLILLPKSFYERKPPLNLKVATLSEDQKNKRPKKFESLLVFEKQEPILVKNPQKITNAKNEKLNDESYHLSIFYYASFGNYSETINSSKLMVSTSQNAPVTVGLYWSNQLKNTEHRFVGSVYLSKLSATSFEDESINRPIEYGFNLYDQFSILNKNLNVYMGGDYESFSTLNTEEISKGAIPETLTQNIFYVTIGMSKKFQFESPLVLGLSFSQSLVSTSETVSSGDETSYKGQLLQGYLTYQFNENVSLNLLYKKHILSGPTGLTIDSFGFGASYQFF